MNNELARTLFAAALGALCMLALVGLDRWLRERDAAKRDAAKRDAGPPDPEADLTAAYMVGYQKGGDYLRDWCRRASAVLLGITDSIPSSQLHRDARNLLDEIITHMPPKRENHRC